MGYFGNAGSVTPRVTVVGEALIDVVLHADGRTERVPGGSPANVALGVARLGVDTAFLGCIGRDGDGEVVVERLSAAGVTVLPGSLSAARTPTAEALIDESGDATYRFDVAWHLPPEEDVALSEVLHIGSYSAFLQPGADTVRELARRSREAGRLTIFDPNIRPALVGEPGPVRERFEGLVALADIVKLSDEDAGWLYPGESEEGVLRRILELGAGLAAITRGADGATLATDSEMVRVAAKRVGVVDTIGAGDSFTAALIQSLASLTPQAIPLLDTAELRALGRRAAVAAGLTVARRGADLPSLAELEAALEASP
ncbi:fructokinase [Leucobacter komagatae]|uniref:Fructokinase n=1 Tax=Leucobacter komagatae TaxID=55969 RepID=A0A542YA50_9MICO|nr:fructokinase [Leucobacter komagatae]TQL44913.1 fructokinase [Leucobacter komagatae]